MAWQSGQCGPPHQHSNSLHSSQMTSDGTQSKQNTFPTFHFKDANTWYLLWQGNNTGGRDCPAPIYCFRLRRQRSSQLTLMIYALNQTYIILAAGTKKPCIVYKCVFQSLILIFPPNLGEEGWEQAAWSCHIRSQEITGDEDHDINIDISWEVRGGEGRWQSLAWAWLGLTGVISHLSTDGPRPLSSSQSTSLSEKQNMQPPPATTSGPGGRGEIIVLHFLTLNHSDDLVSIMRTENSHHHLTIWSFFSGIVSVNMLTWSGESHTAWLLDTGPKL